MLLGSLTGGGNRQSHGAVNVEEGRRERTKTREQLEEEKKISLSIRIKPLDVDSLDSDQLRSKAGELWDTIVRLETEKYDLEERQERQNYDVSFPLFCHFFSKIAFLYRKKLTELKNRQKQQLRQKAMKKGLDPE